VKRIGRRHHSGLFPLKSFSSTGTSESFFCSGSRNDTVASAAASIQRNVGAIGILSSEGDCRCELTSLLPGWLLVRSLYGRFWRRSSLEVLR
jgi:hypothetical protein